MNPLALKVIKSSVLNKDSLISLSTHAELILGRKTPDSQIVVPEKAISRQHCKFTMTDSNVILTDLNSGNGTLLNGNRINTPSVLKAGDTIRTGDTQFEVIFENAAHTHIASEDPKPPKRKAPPTQKMASTQPKTSFLSDILKSPKHKKIIGIALVLVGIALFMFSGSGKKNVQRLPTVSDCTQSYILKDWPFQINYPLHWDVLKRSKADVSGHTYYTLSTHILGKQFKGMDMLIFMQTLEGIPPQFNINDVVDTGNQFFPRALPHDRPLINRQIMEIGGKQWIVGESPVFILKERNVHSLEAYYLENGVRYLIIFHTDHSLFDFLKPVFTHILSGMRLNVSSQTIKLSTYANEEINNLIKLADSMIANRVVQPDNIFFALKNYRQAALIFNTYMFEQDHPFKAKLWSKIKESNQLLDAEVQALKVEMKKGLKLKDYKTAYRAAAKLRSILPDPSDERYKDADYYYELLKSKFGGT